MKRRLYPPVWFLTLLVGQWVLLRNAPSEVESLAAVRWFGWVIGGSGIALFAAAALAFRRYHTTILPFEDKSQRLIESGVFRMSRNPIYLAEAVILSGTALLSGQLWPWGAVPIFIIGITLSVISWEEGALRQRFGLQFEAYCRKTRRWL